MNIQLTVLSVLILLTLTSVAEELTISMPLETARKILKQAGAEEMINRYHFPWATIVEVRQPVKEEESIEAYLERIGKELKKNPGKHGYSVFFKLSDNTQLELVLEVDGDLKLIHGIRLGEDKKTYEGKFEWIRADEKGKIRELKSLKLSLNRDAPRP